MKKILSLTMLAFSLWSIPCYAQSISIFNGITWLSENQNTDGSWGAQADIPFVYSIEAVSALKSSGTASINYSAGMNWLASQDVTSTDELSRKIILLVNAGIDSSALTNTLLSYRNADGEWSYKNSPVSGPEDTSLVLQALKAANYSDASVLFQAINFLTVNQNTDGGWAFVSGGPSNAYVTAIALRTLSNFSSQFSVQSSIQSASAYLLTKQNTDGGFGSSPSNIYETALSVMSLIESGQGSIQPLQNAINYLTNTQLPNGSWDNDPYYTALALQALAKVRPNLQLSSISLSKSMPREGEDVTITALEHFRDVVS